MLDYLDHFVHVALRARKFRGIFDLDQNDEVEVVPHVVLRTDVFLEGNVLVVKGLTFQSYIRLLHEFRVSVKRATSAHHK